jgi:hypothetical protein
VLILFVFGDSFLQPVLQQATDLHEMELRWNRAHTRLKPGAIRKLTDSGAAGWVIPEFAWDPAGRRLLWTQNAFPDGVRVDQTCVVRALREGFLTRLRAVRTVGDIPFGIQHDLRATAALLLQDPATFPHQGLGCGGDAPPGVFAQQTLVGRFER